MITAFYVAHVSSHMDYSQSNNQQKEKDTGEQGKATRTAREQQQGEAEDGGFFLFAEETSCRRSSPT